MLTVNERIKSLRNPEVILEPRPSEQEVHVPHACQIQDEVCDASIVGMVQLIPEHAGDTGSRGSRLPKRNEDADEQCYDRELNDKIYDGLEVVDCRSKEHYGYERRVEKCLKPLPELQKGEIWSRVLDVWARNDLRLGFGDVKRLNCRCGRQCPYCSNRCERQNGDPRRRRYRS